MSASEQPAPAPGGAAPARARSSRYPQSALALIGAILGSLAIVAFIVLVVVRPDGAIRPGVDWHAVAAEVRQTQPSVIDPQLPEGWSANTAALGSLDEVPTWTVGLLSPAQGYVALDQGFGADELWRRDALDGRAPETAATIAGVEWQIVDRRDERDTGNYAYAMLAELPGCTVVLHGSGSDAEFRSVAEAVASASRLG